jgi:prepilin-type N-terminal cleavage/methylation domain-containing protein
MVGRLRASFSRDEGFSLTELLVVIVLMGMVLAAVYSALQLTVRAREIQERNSFESTRMTVPLQMIEIAVSQNTLIEAGSTHYRLSCLTDKNHDGVRERHVFEATTDGRLVERFWLVDSNGQNITATARVTEWQRNEASLPARNVNRANEVRLFTYIDRDPETNEIRELDYIRANQSNEVLVTLAARYGKWDFQESRRIMLRNR